MDYGINFFDTADVYGLGHSEERLASALGPKRKEVVIATKFGVNWTSNDSASRAHTFLDNSRRHVVEALEASLTRLKLDCIPLYQIHWWDPNIPIAETMDALLRCKEAGKIKYIGCSNFSASQISEANQLQRLVSVQIPYNLINRDVEKEVLPCCDQLQIGSIIHSPLAQGLLTGKYGIDVKFPADDRRGRLDQFQVKELENNLKLVEKLRSLGQRYCKSPAQVALRWLLENEQVTAVIPGIKEVRNVEENIRAFGWNLMEEDKESLINCVATC